MSLANGPPHIIGPDGPAIPLPVDLPGCVTGFMDDRCGFIVIAADKGVLLALHPETYSVLDAMQACYWTVHNVVNLSGTGQTGALSMRTRICAVQVYPEVSQFESPGITICAVSTVSVQVAPFFSASFNGKFMTLLLAGPGSVRQVKLLGLQPQHLLQAMPSSTALDMLV